MHKIQVPFLLGIKKRKLWGGDFGSIAKIYSLFFIKFYKQMNLYRFSCIFRMEWMMWKKRGIPVERLSVAWMTSYVVMPSRSVYLISLSAVIIYLFESRIFKFSFAIVEKKNVWPRIGSDFILIVGLIISPSNHDCATHSRWSRNIKQVNWSSIVIYWCLNIFHLFF